MPPGYVDAAAYFASHGITVSGITPGTQVVVYNVSGSGSAVPPSSPNILVQINSNAAISYKLNFPSALTSVSFTRAALIAGPSGITHPPWSMHALNSQGQEVGSAGEAFISSFSNVPAQTFSVTGSDIRALRVDSNNSGAAFSSALLDDLTLGSGPPPPGPPVITNPLDLHILYVNEAFDPISNTWVAKANMPTARTSGPATAEAGGKIYAIGGEIYNDCTPIGTVEAYDPSTDSWVTKTSMLSPHRWITRAATLNGIIYVVGGKGPDGCGDALRTVEAFDPAGNGGMGSWSTKTPMNVARTTMGLAVIHDNVLNRDVLYAIGGAGVPDTITGDPNPPLDTVEKYDPIANGGLGAWTLMPHTMNHKRSALYAATVGTKIYAVAGSDNVTPNGLNTVEEYDPDLDTWKAQTSVVPTRRVYLSACALNGKIYVLGGGNDSSPALSTVEAYDPSRDGFPDAWATEPPMPTARTNFGVAVANNTIYSVGGASAGAATAGQPFIYQITATHNPSSYTAEQPYNPGTQRGLPPGLSFDNNLGIVYGTPTSSVDAHVTFTASNGSGTGSKEIRIYVQPAPPPGPAIISSTCATRRTGLALAFQVLTSNTSSSARFTAGGLPYNAGVNPLTIDPVTGVISGTPASDGTFGVTLGITDGPATVSITLQLTLVSDPTVPILTSSSTATLVPGQPFSYTITASPSGAFSYIGTNGVQNGALPPGLSFVPPATISGICPGVTIPPTLDTIKIRPPVVAIIQTDANNVNGTGTGPLNFFQPAAGSRKNYGSAGTFDINLPLTGTPGIESRSGGANGDYQVVFAFPTAVTFSGASVTPGSGGTASVTSTNTSADGKEVSVNLTNVSNGQQLTVALSGVHDGVNANNVDVAVQMSVLVGDANGNGTVNASDIGLVKSQSGHAITASNYRADVTGNGVINSADISLVKSRSGTSLHTAALRTQRDELRGLGTKR